MPARIAKHPIHPMLIVFPIGLWVFSFVCDLIFIFGSGNHIWNDLAFYTMAGGIIGALLAAIPGLIDFLSITDDIPKRIAIWHMTINLLVVAIFALNLWLRMANPPGAMSFALSAAGVVLLGISGWFGGDLVYVHGVAVAEKRTGPVRSGERKTRVA